jgi:hypothetical protein
MDFEMDCETIFETDCKTIDEAIDSVKQEMMSQSVRQGVR